MFLFDRAVVEVHQGGDLLQLSAVVSVDDPEVLCAAHAKNLFEEASDGNVGPENAVRIGSQNMVARKRLGHSANEFVASVLFDELGESFPPRRDTIPCERSSGVTVVGFGEAHVACDDHIPLP